MSKNRKPPLFYRSFYLTLGGIALMLSVFIWITDGGHSGTWPLKAWIIFFVLLIAGACFLLFGIFASDQKIDSTHIVAIPDNFIVAILAVPLYLVLRGIQRKKHEHRKDARGKFELEKGGRQTDLGKSKKELLSRNSIL